MEPSIQFNFRNKTYSANYVISDNAYPTYIYVSFDDAGLVREFGEEICIHSNGDELHTQDIYSENRRQLFSAVFKAISKTEKLKQR